MAAWAGAPAGDPAAGKAVFVNNCMVCHGADGRGDGPASAGLNPKPANFHDPSRASAEERQVSIVTNGGAAAKLSPVMPSFNDSLSQQEIRNVVAYIRSTFQAPIKTASK